MSLIALALSIPKDLYVIEEKREEGISHETDGDPDSIIELLQAIKQSVEKIEKYIEEKSYEQKTFNLPFSDYSDSVHSSGITG